MSAEKKKNYSEQENYRQREIGNGNRHIAAELGQCGDNGSAGGGAERRVGRRRWCKLDAEVEDDGAAESPERCCRDGEALGKIVIENQSPERQGE